MSDSVVIFTFPEHATAYEALTEVGQLRSVHAAAVVERDQQGQILVPEIHGLTTSAFWEGSLIGALIGFLGGPFGILLGWAAGALIGGSIDVSHERDVEDGIGAFAENIKPGANVLIVETRDATPGPFDDLAARLGGSATHVAADEVRAEVDNAKAAHAAALKAARETRREHHRTELRDRIHHLFHHDG